METKKVDKALMAVQKELYKKGGYIEKTASNPMYKKSKYIPLPKLLVHLTPMLHEQGLLLLQINHPSITEGGANVETIIRHIESGEQVSSQCTAPPMLQVGYDGDKKQIQKLTPQSYGGSISYCRRYCLETLLAIPTEDDDASSASGYGNESTGKKPPAMPKSVDIFDDLMETTGMTLGRLKAELKTIGIATKNEAISEGKDNIIKKLMGEENESKQSNNNG